MKGAKMARQIIDVNELSERLPMSKNQIYVAIKNPENPLPYKKFGKRLYFDLERVYLWFDSLPGRDLTF
jgi:hypothetical protein